MTHFKHSDMAVQAIGLLLVVTAGCRCSTFQDLSQKKAPNTDIAIPEAPQAKEAPATSYVSPVQQQWQERYEKDLIKAGEGAEGWALFSDSSMGHTGQQWLIKTSVGVILSCFMAQQDSTCELRVQSNYPAINLETLQASDSLESLAPSSFDAQISEYRHDRSVDGTVKNLKRFTLAIDHRTLPEPYQKMVDIFLNLPNN
jgi:hypothetical protein